MGRKRWVAALGDDYNGILWNYKGNLIGKYQHPLLNRVNYFGIGNASGIIAGYQWNINGILGIIGISSWDFMQNNVNPGVINSPVY